MTELGMVWVLFCATLVMWMQLGFCMLESGLVRSKNTINVALKNLLDFCIAALLFWAGSYALMFGNGFSWVGTSGFFFNEGSSGPAWTFFLFQMMFCATAATIVSGAVAERMGFRSYLLVTALVSALIYPLFGHWAWSTSGWLRELGFVDFAGGTVVHSVGGWMALAAAVVLGPREGRFESKAALASSHSLGTSTFGVLVLFVAWLGFNGGSALTLDQRVPMILANTALAGSAGALAGLAMNWRLEKIPTLPPTLNGCIAGLVAVTAGCHVFTPASAVLVGAIGGLVSVWGAKWIEHRKIDDVVGAWSAHAASGMWGTLAVALFADPETLGMGHDRLTQLGVQGLGILTAAAWAGGVGWCLLAGLNRFVPLRVDVESERSGLNVAEHGASTEIIDLLSEMNRHSARGDFTRRLAFEPFTEVGQIASEYNRVIEKVVGEMELREGAALRLDENRREAEALHGKLLGSLEYATRIQRAVLPPLSEIRQFSKGVFVYYQPRDLVSGDFYWCRPGLDGAPSHLAVADCTGHGVPGAFMSILGISLLTQIVDGERVRDPGEILGSLHRLTRTALGHDQQNSNNLDGMDIALLTIFPDRVLFAGARRPLWILGPGAEEKIVEIRGDRRSIGGGRFEPKDTVFQTHTILRDRDLRLFLFSDGITDQPNQLREPFDNSRLKMTLIEMAALPFAEREPSFSQVMERFRGGSTQRDDMTLMGLELPAFHSSHPEPTPT